MPLRCWRYRLAYRAIFLVCMSWYIVQVIQTTFLSSQEGRREQFNDLTWQASEQDRAGAQRSKAFKAETEGERNRPEYLRKHTSGGKNPPKNSVLGSERKLNEVHPGNDKLKDTFFDYQVFIQTNSSGIVTKNIRKNSISRRVTRKKKYSSPKDVKAITGHSFEKDNQLKISGAGENGAPVVLTPDDAERSKKLFPLYQFDVLVSDKIAVNRTLPDDRPQRCKAYVYPADLPKTSIIIAFHNEAKSTFLRTIHSVINRSPRHLLEELILVNDASNLGDWHQSVWLQSYLTNLSVPIQLVQSPQRLGLVGARMLGLSKVSNRSEVVTFLDSHCECTDGWLEPLLQRISKDRTRVVSPVVDAVDDHTFQYISTISWPHIGGFSWFPEFMWIRVPPDEKKRVYGDFSLPLRTPTISGGLFAIDKDFFRRLGYYDPDLKIWGGENLELSFKVWQCGGSLEIVPCSRVGHVFRSTTPYSFLGDPENVFLHNNRRILETWAEDYRQVFYSLTPKYREVQYGSVKDRQNLKDTLKCQSFDWYLKNVYRGHILPQNYKHLGQIQHRDSGLCLDNSASGEGKKLGSRVTVTPCSHDAMNQIISLNGFDQLQHDRYCLTPQGEGNFVSLELCALGRTTNAWRQEWSFDKMKNQFIHSRTKQCLTVNSPTPSSSSKRFVMIQNCTDIGEQYWTLQNITMSLDIT